MMNEMTVNDIIEEICFEEVSEYMEIHTLWHHFSRRHRKAMDEILRPVSDFKVNAFKSGHRYISLKKRIWIAVLVIILAAMGITASAVMIRGFNRRVHRDNTELLAANAENCPKTIENVYHLSKIPEGYELYEEISDNTSVYISYINCDTNRCFTFRQSIKEGYKRNFNTENRQFEELEINGHYALYLNDSDSESFYGTIVWDNDDYILQITGDFTKEELVDLAKSAKL